uniref:hypothetical protein n=1 Tax=Trichocoleus desertorum TaxID=1481672 RepID=UPI0025B4B820|nr:hypothetical protein [Trichocoleus desertorum]
MFRLSEEVKQQLEAVAPLITFFGLPRKKQIAVLPKLEEKRKYDFPDGDLITSNALEVLLNSYGSCLNSILMSLMIMLDELRNEDVKYLADLVEHLLETISEILEKQFETMDSARSSGTSEWDTLRLLSLEFQQATNIHSEINKNIIKTCLEYWLHP